MPENERETIMTLKYYEPWHLLHQLQRTLHQPSYPTLAGRTQDDSDNVVTGDWVPAVDIKEEQGRFVIHADIPGVEPDDIDITMENGILSFKGILCH